MFSQVHFSAISLFSTLIFPGISAKINVIRSVCNYSCGFNAIHCILQSSATDCELKLIFVILLSFAEINTRENLCHIKVFVIGFYLLVLQCSLMQVHLFGCMVIITFYECVLNTYTPNCKLNLLLC